MAMLFSKRSTRTRVSCSGWAFYGGSTLYLGKDDVHWVGGGEPLSDTSKLRKTKGFPGRPKFSTVPLAAFDLKPALGSLVLSLLPPSG
ncbi:hypothetical protein BJ742DRAFT_838396 [Cladochytrium replicatum]|nr:hypothetical protein BJ742DRAFT_838396 [Cladochytrium replicatum]